MQDNLYKKIEKLANKKRKKKLIHNTVMGIASIVVFITVYVLILPAITAETEEIDGAEELIPISEVVQSIEEEENVLSIEEDAVLSGAEDNQELNEVDEEVAEDNESTEIVAKDNAETSEETTEVVEEKQEENQGAAEVVEDTEEESEDATEVVEDTEEESEDTSEVLEETEEENEESTEVVEDNQEKTEINLLSGKRSLTDEEIASLSEEDFEYLNSNRTIELDKESSNIDADLSVKLPLGLLSENYYIIANLLPEEYSMEDKTRVFGYDIRVYKKDSDEDMSNDEELSISEDSNPAIVKISKENINNEDYINDKYILYYYENKSFSDYEAKAIMDVSDAITFDSHKFGFYAMFKSEEAIASPDTVDGVKVDVNSLMELSEEENKERFLGVSPVIEETNSVNNKYFIDAKINDTDSDGYIDTKEELDKVFAYDIHLVKDGEIYQINSSGLSLINLEVRVEHSDIKKEDENFYRVYHVVDGKIDKDSKMKILSVEDGVISFETSHFSDYALFKSNIDKNTLYNTDSQLDEIASGEVIDIETFESLVKRTFENNKRESKRSLRTLDYELNYVVEIDRDYTLSRNFIEGLEYNIVRKAGFEKELFHVTDGAKLTLENITISGNNNEAYAPLIVVEDGSLKLNAGTILENNDNQGPYYNRDVEETPYRAEGGAVWSKGNIEINGATIRGCKSQIGGGIYIASESDKIKLTIYDATMNNNQAKYYEAYMNGFSDYDRYRCAGGAIHIGDNVKATIYAANMKNNSSDRIGGAISVRDSLRNIGNMPATLLSEITILGGTYSENYAYMSGGALCICSNSEGTVLGGEFTNNKAKGKDTSSINDTVYSGGAIYVDSKGKGKEGLDGKLIIKNVLIASNKSKQGGGYAGCDTSDTKFYSFRGAVFEKNIDKGEANNTKWQDLAIDSKGTSTFDNETQIDDIILGGYDGNWETKVYADQYESFKMAGCHLSPKDLKEVKKLVKVYITANEGAIGGGIACNGKTNFGEKTPEYGTISITVEKKWENDSEDDRPREIKVDLLKNGSVVDTVTLKKINGWSYSWTGLNANSDWSVKEHEVDGYSSHVEQKRNRDITRKVEIIQDGGEYIIAWKNRPLSNDSDSNLLFRDDIDIQSMKCDNAVWRASSLGDGFKFSNKATGRALSFDKGNRTYKNGLYALDKGRDNDSIFHYKYLDDRNTGVLGTKQDDKWHFIAMNDGDSSNNLSLVTGSEKTVTTVDVYRVVEEEIEFSITNTKNETTDASIQLHKVDSVDAQGLEGAEFTLYEKDSDGVVLIQEEGTPLASGSVVNDSITTDENGLFILENIEVDKVYFIKETKAPNNYKGINDKIIVFKLNHNGEFTNRPLNEYKNKPNFILLNDRNDDDVIAYYSQTNEKHIYIKNDKVVYQLPETGGIGTRIYTIIALIMMIGSLGLLMIGKLKRRT